MKKHKTLEELGFVFKSKDKEDDGSYSYCYLWENKSASYLIRLFKNYPIDTKMSGYSFEKDKWKFNNKELENAIHMKLKELGWLDEISE